MNKAREQKRKKVSRGRALYVPQIDTSLSGGVTLSLQ